MGGNRQYEGYPGGDICRRLRQRILRTRFAIQRVRRRLRFAVGAERRILRQRLEQLQFRLARLQARFRRLCGGYGGGPLPYEPIDEWEDEV